MPEILIIEDDEDIREDAAALLRRRGYDVKTCTNGELALRYLDDSLTRPKVILLDLMMPVMNGWEFCKALSRAPRYSSIPVVIITGTINPEEEVAGLNAAGYLPKPFAFESLLEQVQRFC